MQICWSEMKKKKQTQKVCIEERLGDCVARRAKTAGQLLMRFDTPRLPQMLYIDISTSFVGGYVRTCCKVKIGQNSG